MPLFYRALVWSIVARVLVLNKYILNILQPNLTLALQAAVPLKEWRFLA